MSDSCVWLIKSENLHLGWLVTYVDDILAVSVGDTGKAVLKTIMKQWKCSDLEELGESHPEMNFLGMTLRLIPGKGYFVHQQAYVLGLLQRHNMTTCNGSRVILDSDECLIQEELAPLDKARAEAKERGEAPPAPDPVVLRQAQKAAGELLWLATRTRVDLAYTMHRLCSVVSSNPARAVRMQKRVLRYLKTTTDVGVLFTSRAYLLRCEGSPETPMAEHYLEGSGWLF